MRNHHRNIDYLMTPRMRNQFARIFDHSESAGSSFARPTPCAPFSKMCISAGTPARRRFDVENVRRESTETVREKCGTQGRLVDERAARRVDDAGGRFHPGDLIRAEDTLRLLRQCLDAAIPFYRDVQ